MIVKMEEMGLAVDFELLAQVNQIVKRNVFLVAEELGFEIDEHVGHTNLQAMAEFDGGHDLHWVEDQMWQHLEYHKCLEPVLSQITDNEFLEFYNQFGYEGMI
jgi:hypothetical protein